MKYFKDVDFRPWRYLRRNHATGIPSSHLFADTEAITSESDKASGRKFLSLSLWCACYLRWERGKPSREEWFEGTTPDEFWLIVQEYMGASRPLWLWFHNAGFDLTLLKFWEHLDDGTFEVAQYEHSVQAGDDTPPEMRWQGFVCLESPPTIIKCRAAGTKSTLVIMDSLNYFRCALADLGTTQDVPKLPMPGELAPREEWSTYCRRDVEILRNAVTGLFDFVAKHDLGNLAYTASGQSYNAYRHQFMADNQVLIHGSPTATKLEREGYYGGIVEANYIGRIYNLETFDRDNLFTSQHGIGCLPGPVTVVDVRSFYPSLMRITKVPIRLDCLIDSPDLATLNNLAKSKFMAAHVHINSLDYPYPKRVNKTTVSLHGQFDTVLCGLELKYAMDHGHVAECYQCAVYSQEVLFRPYVDLFWELRQHYEQSGNYPWADLCKLFLNSLIGKFGQKQSRWIDRGEVQSPIPWGVWHECSPAEDRTTTYRSLAWHTQEHQGEGEWQYSFPGIPAAITSAGRVRLRELMLIAGEKQVLYCDTDSLHVLPIGLDNLEKHGLFASSKPGALRVIGVYQTAEYRGLKNYTVDGQHVIAGLKRNAIETSYLQFSQDEFQKLGSILQTRPTGRVCVTTRAVNMQPKQVYYNLDSDGFVVRDCGERKGE